jgi:hypothetical protein
MKNAIEKARGTAPDTYVTVIKGCKSVNTESLRGQRVSVSVTFTDDGHGGTLGVLDPSTKKRVVLPFVQVERLVSRARPGRTGGVPE